MVQSRNFDSAATWFQRFVKQKFYKIFLITSDLFIICILVHRLFLVSRD